MRCRSRFDAEIPAVIAAVFDAAGDRRLHHPAQPPQAAARLLRGPGHRRGEQQVAVLREIDKLDKRGEDAVRATLAGEGFGLVGGRGREDLMAFVARALDRPRRCAGQARCAGRRARRCSTKAATNCARCCSGCRRWACRNRATRSTCRSRAAWITTPALVYETTLDAHPQIGSICSGGRYDNLASHYTKSKLPGVGISIGLTRLFWQLREAGLVATAESSVEVLVALLDDAGLDHALALVAAPARGRHQRRNAAGAAQAGQAVAVRRSRRASASWCSAARTRRRAAWSR